MGVAIISPDSNFADCNLGKVTLTDDVPVRALSIIAPEAITGTTYQLSVSYNPINTNQRGVTWSIESGSEYALISNDGVLSIKEGARLSKVLIKVTSKDNNYISNYANIIVSYKEGGQSQPSKYSDITFIKANNAHNDNTVVCVSTEPFINVGEKIVCFDNSLYNTYKYAVSTTIPDLINNIPNYGAGTWDKSYNGQAYLNQDITATTEIKYLYIRRVDLVDISDSDVTIISNNFKIEKQ